MEDIRFMRFLYAFFSCLSPVKKTAAAAMCLCQQMKLQHQKQTLFLTSKQKKYRPF